MKHDKSYQKGASDERKAITAKIRRLKKSFPGDALGVLVGLEEWMILRVARYNKRPGGLQSRKKAVKPPPF